MGFNSNPRGVRIVLVGLMILFVAMAVGYCSTSKAEEVGISLGFGKASAGSDPCFSSMLLSQTFGEHWLGYLVTHGESDLCHGEPIDANLGLGIIRTAEVRRWTLGFGGGLFEHGDTVIGPYIEKPEYWGSRISDSPQLVASIIVRFRVTQRLSVDYLHNSTGGATKQNRGLNTVTLSGRF